MKKVIFVSLCFLSILYFSSCENIVDNQNDSKDLKSLSKASYSVPVDTVFDHYVPKDNFKIGIWPPFYWYVGIYNGDTVHVPAYGDYKNKYGFSYAIFQSDVQYYRARQKNWPDSNLYRLLSCSNNFSYNDWISWSNEHPIKGVYLDEPLFTHPTYTARTINELISLYSGLDYNQELLVSDTRSTSQLSDLLSFVSTRNCSVMYSSYSNQTNMWQSYERYFVNPDRSRAHWINVQETSNFITLLNLAKSLDINTNEVWLYCDDEGTFSIERLESFCKAAWQTGWLVQYARVKIKYYEKDENGEEINVIYKWDLRIINP